VAENRLNAWEILFRRALEIVDSVAASGTRFDDRSFGGGTVLMRRYRHRVSKDVDIFVPDPQYLGYVSPKLNDAAESPTSKYLETANSVKLFFPEGEIDFIASAPMTDKPTVNETVLGRRVRVETTAEIIAKKVWHRGREFTARDRIHTPDPARARENHRDADGRGRESVAHGIFRPRHPGIQTWLRRVRQDRRGCSRQELTIGLWFFQAALRRPARMTISSNGARRPPRSSFSSSPSSMSACTSVCTFL